MNIYLIQEDNVPVELRVEDKEYSKQSGSIYKGKIKRLVPGMNAAFIDIGQEKEAFLPLKDTCPKTLEHTNCNELKVGDSILVQVKRSPISTKGAKLSCKISLPGKYLVLLPSNEQISISSKFEDPELREEIKQRIKELLEPYNPENYGYIIRTSAYDIPDDYIIEDFLNLKSLWEKILKKAKKKKGVFLLYEEPLKAFSIIRDYAGKFDNILVDSTTIYREIKNYCKEHFPKLISKIKLYRKRKQSLFSLYQIDSLLNKILNTHVWLKSGGYIVINETEALVAIDVNSGSHCKQKTLEETAIKINSEAAKEVARQMRLRDLGGIIIIDFIDMKQEENKEEIIGILKEEFKKDKRPIKIRGFTTLGLLEVTRKKIDESLIKQLSEVCYVCRGKGFTKNGNLILFEIEKTINEMKPFSKLKVSINPRLKTDIEALISSLKLKNSINIDYNINLPVDKFEIERVE